MVNDLSESNHAGALESTRTLEGVKMCFLVRGDLYRDKIRALQPPLSVRVREGTPNVNERQIWAILMDERENRKLMAYEGCQRLNA